MTVYFMKYQNNKQVNDWFNTSLVAFRLSFRKVKVVLKMPFQVLRSDLLHALRKKRPGHAENLENIWLHQDNAPSHTAKHTQVDIDILGFQRVQHPPYSPDLAPLDFAYFPKLKSHLRGKRFADREELQYSIRSFNRTLGKQWFARVFDKWVQRHRKCIENAGEYFEKN